MTIQTEDNTRLERLKRRLGLHTKVDVLRRAMELLEDQLKRAEREKKWAKAVKLCSKESHKTNLLFQRHSRMRRSHD